MSVIEQDLRLSLDENEETPFPTVAEAIRPSGTPIQSDYPAWAVNMLSEPSDQTPATIVFGSTGSGKTIFALRHVAELLAGDAVVQYQTIKWTRRSLCREVPLWRDRETPTQHDPSVRTRYRVLYRKVYEAAL